MGPGISPYALVSTQIPNILRIFPACRKAAVEAFVEREREREREKKRERERERRGDDVLMYE